jgi:N-acetylmuramoyl-L-alanine amidase-like protein
MELDQVLRDGGAFSIFRASRAGAGAALAGLLLSLGACRSAPPAPMPEAPPDPVAPAPAWLTQPLSWDKLEAMEAWLASGEAQQSPGLRLEAELELNEGRLTFSQRDMEKGKAPPETVRLRVEAAKDGFEKLLKETNASPGQRARAQIGQRGAQALLDVPIKPGLAVIPRAQWGAKPQRESDLTPMKGQWSRITVHHSFDTLSDVSSGTLEDSENVVRLIQKYHQEQKGWGDIGYHFLIDSAGRIFEGRDLKWQGAHAGGPEGVNNIQNLGVCMLGDFLHKSPTPAALKSLELLLDSLRTQFNIPPSRVYPHKEFTTTQCPGPALTEWLKHYR